MARMCTFRFEVGEKVGECGGTWGRYLEDMRMQIGSLGGRVSGKEVEGVVMESILWIGVSCW
jgi:hypothetical protein